MIKILKIVHDDDDRHGTFLKSKLKILNRRNFDLKNNFTNDQIKLQAAIDLQLHSVWSSYLTMLQQDIVLVVQMKIK